MKTTTFPIVHTAILTALLALSSRPTSGNTTVTWQRRAYGQEFTCPLSGSHWYWPNNNNWGQSQVLGDPCSEGSSVVVQPSNWSTLAYPNGTEYEVILGGGVANLNLAAVTVNSVTIANDGGLSMQFGSTLTANTYDLQGDTAITVGGGGGGWPLLNVAPGGLLAKSGGAGTFTIGSGITLRCCDALVSVASGTLALPGNGSTYSNCTFSVAPGVSVKWVPLGESVSISGLVQGSGSGTLLFDGGNLNAAAGGVTLNFPATLFQWTGGRFTGSIYTTNVTTVSGDGTVSISGAMYNSGLVRQTGNSTLAINWGSMFENQGAGAYEILADGSIGIGDGGGGTPLFLNRGLLRKSGGSATSTISTALNNQNGVIRVDSGKLSLSGGGVSSNATFQVAGGALLDVSASSVTWQGVLSGTGTGTVLFSGGNLGSGSGGATLNFADNLLQWTGGRFTGPIYNTNVTTISGGGTVTLSGTMYNSGLVRQTDHSTLAINWGSQFDNQVAGTYEITSDGGIAIGEGGGGWPAFINRGRLRKSSGTGTSTIATPFNNQNGSIEVDSGALSVGDYTQGNGALTVKLGGRGAGEFGRLSVANVASLGGPLTASLANGFAPVIGDSFQILSCGSRSGIFSGVHVPAGISVNYTDAGVFLVVTGTVPAQIMSTTLSGGNFRFAFGTVTNRSYTVQYNDDLATNDWLDYTNLTGDGTVKQIVVPANVPAHRFFRVRNP